MTNSSKTDFFLIGAPRCGTTAMCSYLADHPKICFADPKEPLFFCTDLPGLRAVDDEQRYESEFFPNSDTSLMRGEGSVWYLYSEKAVPNILTYNPDAKFIVMLRNPVDLLSSLHQKLIFFLDENETDFSRAWSLDPIRQQGRQIPPNCREPKILCYQSIGRLGSQLQRLLKIVDRSNVHIVLYDDFEQDQQVAYESVLAFLGLEPDLRNTFPKVNANRTVSHRGLYEFLSRPSPTVMKLVTGMKKLVGLKKLGLLPALRNKLTPEIARTPVDRALSTQIVAELTTDIDLLANILERNLGQWKQY